MRYRSFIVIALFIVSTCFPIHFAHNAENITQTYIYEFEDPLLLDQGDYITIDMEGAAATLYLPGQPLLPISTTTLQLPFGIRLIDVTIDATALHIITIDKPILPAPEPFIRGTIKDQVLGNPDPTIYLKNQFFPSKWLSHTIGTGLDQAGNHVTKLTLQIYPIRYQPLQKSLEYTKKITINVSYEPPNNSPFPSQSIYDMVVITPLRFSKALELLIIHKNNHGISTIIKSVNDIYQQYPGFDYPERIKYFIKDAIESWGIKYVLLIGGLNSQIYATPRDDINQGFSDWFIPVRYTNLKENDTTFDPGFISDLYYADIYDGHGNFSNWDTNQDGVFGKWSNDPNPKEAQTGYNPRDTFSAVKPPDTDEIDFYPDVYVGRLPCRNLLEVQIMVRKIIRYEETSFEKSWFNRMIVCGGDPYDDVGTDIIEGEEICEKVAYYMSGYKIVKLYASNQDIAPRYTPTSRNIFREINKGCGFLLFDGHATPAWWNTFWPYSFDQLIKYGGISIYKIPFLVNNQKLPICIIGGCHACQFNVSFVTTLQDRNNSKKMWTYGLPVPECLGWVLTRDIKGGAIATIGSTGLGYEAGGENGDIDGDGINEPDCVEVLGGYLETLFFAGLDQQIKYLGDAWGTAIGSYLDTHPGMMNQSSAKTIEQWVLLGDPSLRIGGYP